MSLLGSLPPSCAPRATRCSSTSGAGIPWKKISEDDAARKAFDPSFGPFTGRILENTQELLLGRTETQSGLAQVRATLTQRR